MELLLKDNKGFTLIELLIVSVLLALMSSILYGTVTGVIQGKTLVETDSETARTVHHLLMRMTKELSSRIALPLAKRKNEDKETDSSGTLVGSQYLIGISKESMGGDQDSLRFVSAAGAQAFIGGNTNFGPVEIEYRLEEPPDGRRRFYSTDSERIDTWYLVREEWPADVGNDDIRQARNIIFPVLEDVIGLNFRYLSTGQWQEEWANPRGQIPDAVEISIDVLAKSGKKETYRTAVALNRPER